jgi:hypothetical protein
MIKSYNISTAEIDDGAEAVREIADQLASLTLRKNTIGLAQAHPEFITSGIYAQVAEALPFPIIGMTTISQCANGTVNTYMLSVMVLTSDDCAFSCGLSEKIPQKGSGISIGDIACATYGEVLGRLEGQPKLALIYGAFLSEPYLCDCIAAMSEKSGGGVPIFGAVANDDASTEQTGTGARVFLETEVCNDRFALALVSGAIEPEFYITSATEESIVMPRVGVITKAGNSRLMEINNVSAVDFLRDVGFPVDNNSSNSGLLSSIFILHIDSGNSCVNVSRIPHSIVEGGGIICGGDVVEGAVLSIAFNTQEVVLETAKMAVDKITNGHSDGSTVILHSCLGRRYGLLSEPQAEMELFQKALGGNFNCMASYANGELCPTIVNNGRVDNRLHNQTLVACVF